MLKRFFHDTKKYYAYTVRATKAQLKAEVANSYLNWIWWILQPICFVAIYTLIFAVFFKLKEEHIIPFVTIGVGMWDFFSYMLKNSVNLMRTNKSIVSKVYLPKHILLLVRLGVNGFKMLISFAIVIVVMIVTRVPISWTVLMTIPVLIVFMLMTFALSCFLLHFGVFVADLKNIIEIFLKMVFYVSGIFYSVPKRIPAPFGQILVNINPAAFCIDAVRKTLIYKTMPNMWILLGWLIVSVGLSILGIYVIYKNENSYVKSI